MPRKKKTDSPGKAAAPSEKTALKTRPRSQRAAQSLPPMPVVGLGASAGGLEALKAFFTQVPPSSGMAFIVAMHQAPDFPSLMPELLQTVSPIPVSLARDGQAILPNQVYVTPPDKEICLYKGKIQLLDRIQTKTPLPIDAFFRSLAQDQGSLAAAIVLSGTGSDGTMGIKEIKARGGLVFVQSQESAGFAGMPGSAIHSGVADLVLAPGDMPRRLVYFFSLEGPGTKPPASFCPGDQDWLNKIFFILRSQVGHDFSSYKSNTILRRIQRRMSLNHIDCHETYVRFSRENPGEIDALFRELLIGVTRFFRDPDSFDLLKTTVLPELLKNLKTDAPFRVWVPGCSTGEEVYSLAITLKEVLEAHPKRIILQLFGTDIDSKAIDKAREGVYPASIAADLSQERLNRFFLKEGEFFRIRKEIRDCVIFSVQDIVRDPPFSRLNLLCCRNLMIYLNTGAQKKLLPLLHYTLVPGGILMLGSSETIGGFTHLFDTIDRKWKVFRRREVARTFHQITHFPQGLSETGPAGGPAGSLPDHPRQDISHLTQNLVLDLFAPTAVLTDGKGEILAVQGRTGRYLEMTSGLPTSNILDLARDGLRIALSSALRVAGTSAEKVIQKNLCIGHEDTVQHVTLHVCPVKTPKELAGRFLVVFEDVAPQSDSPRGTAPDPNGVLDSGPGIAELERELQVTRESHQTIIEELESSNEELKSTNEELQSANEELQSTNEELESSKEELQSLNEELQTVNTELQTKVEELSAAHDDMRNLLNSTEIATIFVNNDLRVRRFTPQATAIVNLIPADLGRPLQHVAGNLKYGNMIQDLRTVLKNLIPMETEVQTVQGNWFNMRIIPYRTTDNRIDGAVMTFANIEDQKKTLTQLENLVREMADARELVNAIFDTSQDPMVVLDKQGRIVIANPVFASVMDMDPEDLAGTDFMQTLTGPTISLASQAQNFLERNKDCLIETLDIQTAGGEKQFSVRGRILKHDQSHPYHILLHFLPREEEEETHDLH